MEAIDAILEFLSEVHWVRLIVTVLVTAVAVVAGIWWPARVLEYHTNQPLVRWVWYVLGTALLVMIYISMHGYGQFWVLYGGSEVRERAPAAHSALG